MITLCLPYEKDSAQLEKTLDILANTSGEYTLELYKNPTVNVSEARQIMMDNCKTKHICFLDYDSEMVDPEWLNKIMQTMQEKDAAGVFPLERWGVSKNLTQGCTEDREVSYGPAACMLLDMDKVGDLKWDKHIGLRSGWLGGDFEEVDFCFRALKKGHKLYRCASTHFNHTGGKTTLEDFVKTDRSVSVRVMRLMLDYKYRKDPDNEDYFKGIKYVRADPNNDCTLGKGQSFRKCYHEVIKRNGLSYIQSFKKLGLV